MTINDIQQPVTEAGYPGNIGIMELVKFMRMATPADKLKFDQLLQHKKTLAAWKLLQSVTGARLADIGYTDTGST